MCIYLLVSNSVLCYSVEIMTRKLDAENLGIILLNAFMEEFFPEEKQSTPDTFTLFHYNGQPRSCPDGRVRLWTV